MRYWGALAAVQAAKIRPGGSIIITNGDFNLFCSRFHILNGAKLLGAVIHKPMKGWSYTAGAAGAVDSIARGLAVDLAPIRVNCVTPGVVKTDVSSFVIIQFFYNKLF